MGTVPVESFRDNGEHRSVTLGDLAALIAGIAVVLVLPTRQSYWPLPSDFLGSLPRWLPWFFCLRAALGAACVALVPVVFFRRARYGELARPAEFLALCAAIPFLADSIETALMWLSFRLQNGQTLTAYGRQWMPSEFTDKWWKSYNWVWEQSLLLGGAVALVAFAVGRRKLPGWLLTALLILAWFGAYEQATKLVSRGAELLITRVNSGPVGWTIRLLSWALFYSLPRFILYSVPAIVAVRDLRREGRARPTWLEWTCLGLAAALFLIAEPTELVRNYSVSGSTEPRAMEIFVREATLLAAVIIGLFVVRIVKGNASRIESADGLA